MAKKSSGSKSKRTTASVLTKKASKTTKTKTFGGKAKEGTNSGGPRKKP